MPRNWLLAHWRRIAMQGVLCALLLVTVGLAAFVSYEKRLALRLPLNAATTAGRLVVALPRGWSVPLAADRREAGEFVQTDEIVPEPLTGRRLTVQRMPADGLVAPLDFLVRNQFVTAYDLSGKDQGTQERIARPAHVQHVAVGAWPGVMVSRTTLKLNGRRAEKQVLACAVMARKQAVLIRLEGPGTVDAADEELVREIAENAKVRVSLSSNVELRPESLGSLVELEDGVFTAAPDRYNGVPDDDRTSRTLLCDGSDGHWTAVELVPCLWLDESPEEQLLTMLSARDRTWHSASVTKVGDGIWRADRVPQVGELEFPARAYCFSNGADQALLAIIRGGYRDDGGFESAWAGISRNVRFTRRPDLAALLENGKKQAHQFTAEGLGNLLIAQPIEQTWFVASSVENSAPVAWMTLHIAQTDAEQGEWEGARTPAPLAWSAMKPMATGEGTYQKWEGKSDLSTYGVNTDQIISGRGESDLVRKTTQRVELKDGRLTNSLSGNARVAPPQYVPGAWLPLILGHVRDEPMILRCESFVACDGAAPPGLLTLLVTRDRADGPNCVRVTVNGSGRVARFWYDSVASLMRIDLGGARAQPSLANTP